MDLSICQSHHCRWWNSPRVNCLGRRFRTGRTGGSFNARTISAGSWTARRAADGRATARAPLAVEQYRIRRAYRAMQMQVATTVYHAPWTGAWAEYAPPFPTMRVAMMGMHARSTDAIRSVDSKRPISERAVRPVIEQTLACNCKGLTTATNPSRV